MINKKTNPIINFFHTLVGFCIAIAIVGYGVYAMYTDKKLIYMCLEFIFVFLLCTFSLKFGEKRKGGNDIINKVDGTRIVVDYRELRIGARDLIIFLFFGLHLIFFWFGLGFIYIIVIIIAVFISSLPLILVIGLPEVQSRFRSIRACILLYGLKHRSLFRGICDIAIPAIVVIITLCFWRLFGKR